MKVKKLCRVILPLGLATILAVIGSDYLTTAKSNKEKVTRDEGLDLSNWDDVHIGEANFQVPKELTNNDLLSGLVSWTSGVGGMMEEDAGVEGAKGTLSSDNFLLHNIKIYQPSDETYPITSACIASFTCDELLQYIQDSSDAGVEAKLTSDDIYKTFENLKDPKYYVSDAEETDGGFTYIRKIGSDTISDFEGKIGFNNSQGTAADSNSDTDSVLYMGIKDLNGVDHMIYGVFQYEKGEHGKSLIYANKIMNTVTFNE